MRLSIVIPACNEEKRIGPMLDAYLPFFTARYGGEVEFIVVVNGSTDRTAELVQGYGARYPALRWLVEPGRIGKGGALMRGFAAARGERIGFVDADGATPPEAFQALVEGLGDAGAIIASRWRRESRVSPRQPLSRRVASRLFNALTRLLFGLRLTDTQCGAKLMAGAALRRVLPHLGITQWAFDVDLLFQLRRAGYRIAEVPTVWHDVSGSKVEILRASLEMTAALLRLRLLYSPLRWVVALYDRYLAPFVHPPGFEEDRLFRHSLVVLAGAHTANVLNLVFQVCMVALLGDRAYGELGALLGLFMVLSMPMSAMSQTAAHFCAAYLQQGRPGRAADLVRRLARHLTLALLPAAAAVLLLRERIAAFYRLEQPGAVLLTAAALALTVLATPLMGALTGCQAFLWSSAATVGGSLVRLAAALALVWGGGAVMGALLGHTLGALAALALAVLALSRLLGGAAPERAPLRPVYAYFGRYLLALAGFAVLCNADVPLVKRHFDPLAAGLFAKAALVARVVIFLPLPVAGALFPKVVSAGGATEQHFRTLAKGVALVALMAGSVAALCLLLPGPLLLLFRERRAAELAPWVRGMALAMTPLSMVSLLMSFELSQRRFRIAWPLLLCAAAYVAAAALWHPSIGALIGLLAAASWLALAGSLACLPWPRGR